jgi:hypothetical protein
VSVLLATVVCARQRQGAPAFKNAMSRQAYIEGWKLTSRSYVWGMIMGECLPVNDWHCKVDGDRLSYVE